MAGSSVGPSHAAVPALVVALAVAVVLAVGLVVLVVVADQVAESEPVVARDEVDARARLPPVVRVQVARPGEPRGHLVHRPAVPLPELPHAVPVLAVPLRPARREVAHLIPARPDVPRLGDHLHLRQHRVLNDHVEEALQLADGVEVGGQGAGEVEPEPVHVHFRHPVPQAVHEQLQDPRVGGVQRVPAPGVVHVVPRRCLPPSGSTTGCPPRGSRASAPGGCPPRCGCKPRPGSPRCRPCAASAPST